MAFLQSDPPPRLGQVWKKIVQELPERTWMSIQKHFQSKILPVLSANKKGVDTEDMERWKMDALEIVEDQFARNELKYYEDINFGKLVDRVGKGCSQKQIAEFFSGIRSRGVKSGQSIHQAITFALEKRLSRGDEANAGGSLHVGSYKQFRQRRVAKGGKPRGENLRMWKETVLDHWERINSFKTEHNSLESFCDK